MRSSTPEGNAESRTFFGDGEVEREVLLDVARIILELEQAVVELGVERGEIVEVALPSEPLRAESRVSDAA